ncbi:hypothetical protein M5689_013540 [Euphorbia peplus]|nr:hypothetical protein M5689_013540 [Euphorbia peplus]
MSHSHHRKVHSQGNIPFSWEDSPGISKAMPQDNFLISDSFSGPIVSDHHEGMKIPPPPPCQSVQPPRRSFSGKGMGWWHLDLEDPFLAAYKECTKNVGKLASKDENKKNVKVRRRSKFMMFSCKNSCDVKDDSLVKLSNLPPISRARVKGR